MRKIDVRFLSLCAIGALFSGLLGFMVAAGNNVTFDGHEHLAGPLALHSELNNLRTHSSNHEKMHDTPLHIAKNIAVPIIKCKPFSVKAIIHNPLAVRRVVANHQI